jgi:hypothetical protein
LIRPFFVGALTANLARDRAHVMMFSPFNLAVRDASICIKLCVGCR